MLNELTKRNVRRKRREMHIKNVVRGKTDKPRLTVSKTNKHLFAQLIDDEKQITLASFGTMTKGFEKKKSKETAREIGTKIAEMAKEKQIDRVVFDRKRFKYHGIIAHVADAAREAGLQF